MASGPLAADQTAAIECILILGGSFDPVHVAHVALAKLFNNLLKPTQLRIIPTGWSWQKAAFHTDPQHRLAMLSLAFAELAQQTTVVIDQQEIQRAVLGIPSYSIDTLEALRAEVGTSASLIFVMGADQLQQLQSWQNWQHLFELTHIAVAARPGFTLDAMDHLVASEFKRRAGSVGQLQNRPCGHTYLCADLAIDISSTQIRNGKNLSLVPSEVLDYIQQHHLY